MPAPAEAATATSRATGNWNANATWSTTRTGTISTQNKSTTVNGVNTLFLTELAVGDVITTGADVQIGTGTVQSIASDTQLTLSQVAGTNTGGIAYKARKVPLASDDVVIANLAAAHTVTVTAAATAATLSFTGGNQAATLTINAGILLTVNGDTTVNSPTAAINKSINLAADGRLTVNGDLFLIGGGAVNQNARLILGSNANTRVIVTGNVAGTGGGAFNARGVITFSGLGTMEIGGNFAAGATLTSGSGAIEFNGAGAQTIGSYNTATLNYFDLTINKPSGTATLGGNVLVRGDFSNNAEARFSGGACLVAGDTFTVTFQPTVAAVQNLTGAATDTTFCRVTVNNTSGLTLGHNLKITNAVNGLLTLTAGPITTGANYVYIGNGSNIGSVGGTDFIIGNLRKSYATGNILRTFEVGSGLAGAALYSPVGIRLGNVTAAGDFTVSTTGGDHPNIGISSLNPDLSVNRYWTLTNNTVTFAANVNTQIVFTFVNPGDVDGGVNTANFSLFRFVSPNWTEVTPSTPAATTMTISNTGITPANINGDYQIAEKLVLGTQVGRLNAYDTGSAGVTGFIRTRVAGPGIPVELIALNAPRTALDTTFAGAVRVELLNSSDDSGTLDPNGCRSSWNSIQTLSTNPVFIAGTGRLAITFTEANSYPNARLRISFPATGVPTRQGCSNDNFAIRPHQFANFSVSDNGTPENFGTTRTLDDVIFTVPASGGKVHKAGRPFSVRATAVNSAGSPATTDNYTGAPTATASSCVPLGAACTPTTGILSLNTSFASGLLTSDVATYNQVGSFSLQLKDTGFSSVDSGDGTPADCSAAGQHICSSTINVGRFVPDHLVVSLNTPLFATGCGSGANSFTYIGARFDYTAVPPVITVTGEDFSNNPTTFYAGNWFRVSNASLTAKTYTTAVGTLDTSGVPGTDPSIDPALRTLTFSSGTGLAFNRTAPTTPASPFNADISLGINVIDADNVAYASNPVQFGAATAGNGIAFNHSKQMRFGRLRANNANGSQLVPLSILMETQYWNGTAFVANNLDSCTAIANTDVALGNYTGTLNPSPNCVTAISGGGAFSQGRRTFQLAAPGAIHNGSVNLTVNLATAAGGNTCTAVGAAPAAASTANRPYLQGQWDNVDQGADGRLYDDNPAARATFGIYRGSQEVIHIRENF